MSTDAEKFEQIAALCDELDRAHAVRVENPSTDIVRRLRAILAEPGPAVAFTRDRVRAELLASLPADPKWATWVDGVLDRLELPGGVTLSREDASLAAYFVRDHIGTGWADPIWPTDDHLRALVARLEGASS